MAVLQGFVGDDVENAVMGLGLVRGIDLLSAVPVPPALETAVALHMQRGDRDKLRASVEQYMRLVFRALLTERYKGTKQTQGRFKFTIPGVARGSGFDADAALGTDSRLCEVVATYVDAVLGRLCVAEADQGRVKDCQAPVGHGPPLPSMLGSGTDIAFGACGVHCWHGCVVVVGGCVCMKYPC
jgi:hypothetical protein